jgi:hypothetical protein
MNQNALAPRRRRFAISLAHGREGVGRRVCDLVAHARGGIRDLVVHLDSRFP